MIIKFSHRYSKLINLAGQEYSSMATLLDVVIVNLEDLSERFLGYDTDYGLFKLPKTGKYMMLLFKKSCTDDLFTTLRRWTEENEKKYRSGIGRMWDIEIKLEVSK